MLQGAQALLEVRLRFLVGSGRPSMLMLVRSAAALTPFGGLAADADAVMM